MLKFFPTKETQRLVTVIVIIVVSALKEQASMDEDITASVAQAIRSTYQTIAYIFIDSSMEITIKRMAATKNCLQIDYFLLH